TTFNGTGYLAYHYAPGSAAASFIAFDAMGRILVSGGTKATGGVDASASLWRFFASGAVDGSLPGSGGFGLARVAERAGADRRAGARGGRRGGRLAPGRGAGVRPRQRRGGPRPMEAPSVRERGALSR